VMARADVGVLVACAEHMRAADGHAVFKGCVPHPGLLAVGHAWVRLELLFWLIPR
jgi:hypothetical protein